jgi:DNA-binding CsgD family transcriptional regulator
VPNDRPIFDFTPAEEARAMLIAAATGARFLDCLPAARRALQAGLPAPRTVHAEITPNLANAPQTTPNDAIALQTTPPRAPAQNEPTAPPPAKPRQSAPNHANAPHARVIGKTNPPDNTAAPAPRRKRPPRPLTPAQLRAARLLAAGQSTNAVAAALGVDRHTVADWKRHPYFQPELRRLISPPPRTW